MENEDECTKMFPLNLPFLVSSSFNNILLHDFVPPFHGLHTLNSLPYLIRLADMIHESSPVTNAFVSVPADMGQLNCAAFLAGIVAGVLDSARFVSTYTTC